MKIKERGVRFDSPLLEKGLSIFPLPFRAPGRVDRGGCPASVVEGLAGKPPYSTRVTKGEEEGEDISHGPVGRERGSGR